MASDADIESFTSEEFSNRDWSVSSNSSQFLKFLVFDCKTDSDSITPGEIIQRAVGNRKHELVQRDLIVSFMKSPCNVVSHEQFADVFGATYEQFLSNIHSIVISLPFTHLKSDQVIYFISKEFSNTPSPVCQNTTILESPVPFCCRIFTKPVNLDNIEFMKRQLSNELIHLCHRYDDGETIDKINHYNMGNCPAFYLKVIKYKTNVLKFIYHQSCNTSVTHHIEYQSTDTLSQVLWNYHRLAEKNIPEFSELDIFDLSLTNDYGNMIDNDFKTIISLLVNEKKLILDRNIFHSYPTFLVHLTPRAYTFWKFRLRVLGDDRAHMHPFTVFIRENSSTHEMRQEIAKHIHWDSKSFEVFPPNYMNKLEEVENLKQLKFHFNSASVFTVRRIGKVTIIVNSDIEKLDKMVIEEYPTCSIEELKNKISTKYDISTNEFDLMHKGTFLEEHTLLEEFAERKAFFDISYNQNRLVFRLYVHKGIANRARLLFRGKFLHMKVDDPDEKVGDVIRTVSEVLEIKEDELSLILNGVCLDRNESYQSCSVTDSTIVCMCCCTKLDGNDGDGNDLAIFHASADGTISKETTPSVAALQLKLSRLQMREQKKRSTVLILNRDTRKKSGFHRMASVPNRPSRSSLAANEPKDSGYKSDTDLVIRQNKFFPKPSPSDSQLYTHAEQSAVPSSTPLSYRGRHALPLLNMVAAHGETEKPHYYIHTPPSVTEVAVQGNSKIPGKGYQFVMFGVGNGNIPNLPSIIGSSPSRIFDGSDQNYDSDWNRMFLRIAKEITLEWKNVARYLKIPESDINIIDQNNSQIEQKSYSMLIKWREMNGPNATKELLKKALVEDDLRRVAEIVDGFEVGEEE